MRRSPLLRILLFLGLAALAVVAYLFLLNILSGRIGSFSAAVPAIFLTLAALAINWRFFGAESRSLADVGFDRPLLRLGQVVVGFVAGSLTVAAWIIALRSLVSVAWRVASPVHASAAAGSLVFTIFNNFAEELVYRSYLFVLIMRTYGTAAAVISTSVLFTLLHIQAGVPWPNALAGVLTSAVIFAALFVRWKSVPLVLAFHAGMNVTQEVLGLRHNGLTLFVPQFRAASTSGVLVWAAGINICVAGAVLFSARKPPGACRATSSGPS